MRQVFIFLMYDCVNVVGPNKDTVSNKWYRHNPQASHIPKDSPWPNIIKCTLSRLELFSEDTDSKQTFHTMRIIRNLLRSRGEYMKEYLELITRNAIEAHSDVLVSLWTL